MPASSDVARVYRITPGDVDRASLDLDLTSALADGCLGIAAAATFAGVGRSLLYEAIAARELTIIKVGRRTLVPKRSLVGWLASRAVPGRI